MQRCDSFRISRLIVPILGIGKPEPHSPDDVGAGSIRIFRGGAMPDKSDLTHMLRQMWRIRLFEERLRKFHDYRGYFASNTPTSEAASTDELLTCVGYDFVSKGLIGGAVHLSIGQEAVAVGVCAHLNDDDCVVTSHRGHGQAIAKGIGLSSALAELMGRSGGCSGGFGGSMHLFDAEHGFLGGNGIVGGQLPISLGPAFAAKYRGTRQVSVAFFGDGAVNQGTFHESLNLAALWRLPVLFVCDNNLYANTTPAALGLSQPDVAQHAHGYGIPGEIVDGQDVLRVYEVAGQAVTRARNGKGPSLIEAKTYRYEAHCGVAAQHQNPEECEQWKQRDPIELFGRKLLADGVISEEQQRQLYSEVAAELDAAEAFAVGSPLPTVERLTEFLI
ncbi:MAG: pyruvate dehydrogenase (acetyl-transferring) E1 component subunit alpha [Armatimonadetes bacterium CG_4_8_14_3_um_filter_58_9]|nr:MAG: pyruvate dehydrogenase (acetyl-transferring) E1 component subunit alpha [Armatimonadetes bacterium CG_4_8_14_3_um_filter_58_9]PJB62932.1 MAG: pyruvate dehydrogenase (acetyl-transferring) E1 component subunit alpha [Armatimonadetes bacterium CG_4_9_14_3_um_filter_58_7]